MFISSLIYIQADFNKGRTIEQSSQTAQLFVYGWCPSYSLTFVKCISYRWFPPFIFCSFIRENKNVFEELYRIKEYVYSI